MYLRIIRAQTQPGQVNEFAELWQEFASTKLKSLPRFHHAYLAANRDTNLVTGVAVWEAGPDLKHADQALQQMAERAGDILAGPPAPEDYEVLAEV